MMEWKKDHFAALQIYSNDAPVSFAQDDAITCVEWAVISPGG